MSGGASTTNFTATGGTVLGSATTTNLFATNASTTNFFGAGLSFCQGGNVLTWANGSFGCAADQTGVAGGAWPFTPSTNYGLAVQSTSTPIWATAGLMASSTSYFVNASTTALTVSGTGYFPGGIWDASGYVGIGTKTPSARLAIDTRGATATPLAIRTTGLPGAYTATSTGIFVYDALGQETLRIVSTDPSGSNWNSTNLFIGAYAGSNNPTDNVSAGYANTGIGNYSLLYSTGYTNTALGSYSLGSNTTGYGNIAIGDSALYNNRSATTSVAVGSRAGYGQTSGYSNQGGTYVGTYSGYNLATSSDYNTFLGFQSGYDITTGTQNIVIGPQAAAGTGLTTGYNNILLGYDVRAGLTRTGNNQLNIGNLIFGTGLATSSTLSSGSIGIGTTTPTSKLTVYGDAVLDGSNRYLNFGTATGSPGYGIRDNNGTMEVKNSGGTWSRVQTATSGPSFSVHKNGANQSINSSTETLVTWSAKSFDTNNNFNLSTERFTPTVPGKYILTAQIEVDDLTDAYNAWVAIRKNDSIVSWGKKTATWTGDDLIPMVTVIADANGTTDYFDVVGYQDNGNDRDIYGGSEYTKFSGALIAPTAAVNGVWSISDARYKENISTTTSGLDLLRRIPVYDFNLIGEADRRQQGFIAQELYQYYPEAVTVGGENAFQSPWLVDYGRLTPLVVRAVQEINLKMEDLATTTPESAWQPETFATRFFAALKDRLGVWFAEAANGIAEFFAQVGNFGRVNTDKLCVGSTCITETQLAAVLSATAQPPPQGNASGSTPAPTNTEPPPTDTATSTDSTTSPSSGQASSPQAGAPSRSALAPEILPTATDAPPVAPEEIQVPEADAPTTLGSTEPGPTAQ